MYLFSYFGVFYDRHITLIIPAFFFCTLIFIWFLIETMKTLRSNPWLLINTQSSKLFVRLLLNAYLPRCMLPTHLLPLHVLTGIQAPTLMIAKMYLLVPSFTTTYHTIPRKTHAFAIL